MAKKSVTWEQYSINIDEKGAVKVTKAGAVCDNTKATLLEIAQAMGFEIDDKWNIQQVGAKLVKFLSETAFEHIERPKTEKSNIEKKHIASQVKVSKAVIARTRAQKIVDPIECQMVIIPSGCYRQIWSVYLGEKLVYPNGDRRRKQELQNIYEDRSRYVTISHAYSICKYPVTQRQWKMVMGEDNNPSKNRGDDLPITGIMYDDIMVFIKKLNILTGLHYRLPTYAESYWAAIGADKSNGSIIDARYYSDTPIDQLKMSNPKGLYYYCASEFCGEFWESEKEWIDGLAVIDPSGPKEVKPIISEQPTNSYDKQHKIIPPTEGFPIVTFHYHAIDRWKRGWILDNVIDHLSRYGTMFRLVRIIE